LSVPLSCNSNPAPDSPDTVPPIVYVVSGGPIVPPPPPPPHAEKDIDVVTAMINICVRDITGRPF
jgi:hypothetical protein